MAHGRARAIAARTALGLSLLATGTAVAGYRGAGTLPPAAAMSERDP
jgi:hypothetical protein